MISIENKIIKDIPILHVADQQKWDQELPLILFVHGFTSIYEKNLYYAYLLAKKGFRVILPEALYHGERNEGLSGHNLNFRFWDIVLQTIEEIDIIKTWFEKERLIDPSRIGLAGTSMGGIVTLGALTKYPWIKAAVSLMGMPYYEKFAQWQLDEMQKNGLHIPIDDNEIHHLMGNLRELDLSMQTNKLQNRPLLFWHGRKDPVVPFDYTYHFFETIQQLYKQEPEKLKFIIDEKAGHNVSNEGVAQTVKWFEKFV
ncbi:alpha/beta fold hydrolase [Cytobacillus praedii]|uniref:alpha/beta fold hydrolase n=1 Tax=Cytobacillus praedii TaxID=1742358 RepID=UPI003AF639A7